MLYDVLEKGTRAHPSVEVSQYVDDLSQRAAARSIFEVVSALCPAAIDLAKGIAELGQDHHRRLSLALGSARPASGGEG